MENNPDFLLEAADECRYFDYIDELNANAIFRKDKIIDQTTQITEKEKLSQNSENVNNENDSERQDESIAREELKNEQELLTNDVNDYSINDEKIKIGKADMQSNEKINEFE